MNSTSLYVTTNQIILKSQPENPSSWQDLYRLLPYLRNSLCCVVCGGLLVEPASPAGGKCQHHLCQHCTGGKRKIKPACIWCKDCDTYNENKQLRTLLQCYKKMCVYLSNSGIYTALLTEAANGGMERAAANLIGLIKEGATFCDAYESNIGLSKETYSILPCVFTNSATQTSAEKSIVTNSSKNSNGTPMYSVMFAGSGNKITIKRKQKPEERVVVKKEEKSVFKKPTKCVTKTRRGCRCGNATATPGKLTCCGQRCPCYVDSKACVDCKCRGCRNPHTLDGNKVLNLPHHIIQQYQENNQNQQLYLEPHQPQMQEVEEQVSDMQQLHVQQLEQPVTSSMPSTPMLQHVKIELDANLTFEQLNEHLSLKVFEPFSEVPPTLPHTFLMHTKREDLEDEEITVDV